MIQPINHQAISSTFNFGRFKALLIRYLVENKKSLMLSVGAAWVILILLGAFTGHFGNENSWYTPIHRLNNFIAACIFTSLLLGQIAASLTFTSMKTKQTRLDTLMLPSSALEKFFVRITIYTLIFHVVLIVGIIIGDFFRNLFIAPHNSVLLIANLDWFFDTPNYTGSLLSFYIFTLATYTFGSSISPRYSFLKTTIAVFIINIVALIFISSFNIYKISWIDETTITIFFLISAVILYVASYFRFAKSQLV